MKHLFFPILGALFLTSFAAAQEIDWARVHDVTMRGIHHLYNMEVDRARAAFDSVTAMAPNDPRGPFFNAIIHVFIYNLNRSESEYDEFFKYSDKVIEVCERLVDQDEKDAVAKFYLGGIYGYRGLAYQASGSMLSAVKDGLKGFSNLEEAVTLKPDLYDAHMGFGLFRYLLAKVPRTYRWILSLIGFGGDLEGGLNSLRLAAEKGVYARTEARLYLAQFLLNEHRDEEALTYLRDLLREYPDNTLFAVLYASWQMRLNNYDEAFLWAKKAEEINGRNKIKYGEEFIYSTLGGIYYVRNEFLRARDSYATYLEKMHIREYITNWIYYRIAVSYEMTGSHARAVEVCRMMKDPGDGDRAMEVFYFRRGQRLAGSPFSESDALMVKAGNEATLKHHDAALKLYEEAAGKAGDNVDALARALYGMQQAYYELKRDNDVVAVSGRLTPLRPPNELWVVPHGYLRLGQTLARQGRIADAKKAFEAIDAFDDYDYQSNLEGRVEEELKNLEGGAKTAQ